MKTMFAVGHLNRERTKIVITVRGRTCEGPGIERAKRAIRVRQPFQGSQDIPPRLGSPSTIH